MIVSKASNASEATSSKTLGLLAQDLAINEQGFVITEGLLDGLDTSSANAGDPIWLGVDGNLIYGLANKPKAPAHLVFIGIVTRTHQNQGEVFCKIQNGFELNEIHDALITSPANGEVLTYEASTSLWKNKPISRSFYTHNQLALSNTWIVNHNLGFYPNVTALDSASSNIFGEVTYLDSNSLTISFSTSISGVAYLS